MITVRFLALVLVAFLVSPGTHASTCPSENVVADPPIFNWDWDDVGQFYTGTLEMGEASFTINGETLTTRAYRQAGGVYSIPGPTIVMKPGHKYVLRFRNTLPYQPKVMQHNVFKDPNITNVHTHGLHISGESPGDDVTRYFEGGYGGDYVYDIRENHMGGTFWYHAHHHGSTFLQVSSGAFGLMIIDDEADEIPPNVAAMVERHLILGYLEPGISAGTGGDTLISGTFSEGWTINGTASGNLCAPPDTWQHWRMLVADQDARLVDLQIGPECEMALLARDGVWRTEAPAFVTSNTLTLTGASRADFAVRCSADSSISIGGVEVAKVYVDGAADPSPHPFGIDGVSPWSAKRPHYLRDLRPETVTDTETIRMGARSVLGRKFDPNEPNLIHDADGVKAWSLRGATNHPFHLHIYHVQVQSDCGPYEAGEFYDVVAGNCDLRFDLSAQEAYEGRTILHCHILEHEDQGAMGWLKVVGGQIPPDFPDGMQFSEKYPLDVDPPLGPPAAPSGLLAEAASSSSINLSWVDNSNNEDRFDIERSDDGSNFTNVAITNADVTAHADTNLNPSTTYHYRVRAGNGAGDSTYSGTAVATTDPSESSGTAVVVSTVSVSTQNASKGSKWGFAEIAVTDDLGNAVPGALVSGVFSGDISETVDQVVTEANGVATVRTNSTAKPLNNLSFCVTAASASGLQDFAGEQCGSL